MRERVGPILKIVCLVLAALLLYQLVQVGRRVNPLSHVTIPDLPKLASDTNAPSTSVAKGMTNSAGSMAKGTNSPRNEMGTNSVTAKLTKEKDTNVVSGGLVRSNGTNVALGSTNIVGPAVERETGNLRPGGSHVLTNALAEETPIERTNSSSQSREQKTATTEINASTAVASVNATNNSPLASATNAAPIAALLDTNMTSSISPAETNDVVSGINSSSPLTFSTTNNLPAQTSTNVFIIGASEGTNNPVRVASASVKGKTNRVHVSLGTNGMPVIIDGTNIAASGTNSSARLKSRGTNSPPSMMAMNGMNMSPSMRGGGMPAELPPEIKARVDRIYESELFGQVMHPVPMGLLGIAGNSAFLRSPSGQTGLVKEGDSLGEIKLLRIGINRVLVEQNGTKSELKIFDGYGGESLMPKDKETSK